MNVIHRRVRRVDKRGGFRHTSPMRRCVALLLIACGSAVASLSVASAEVVVAIRYLQPKGVSHAHLYLYADGGKLLRQLTKGDSGQDFDPLFAPDGKTIVFRRELKDEIVQTWSINRDGSALKRLDAPPDWYTTTRVKQNSLRARRDGGALLRRVSVSAWANACDRQRPPRRQLSLSFSRGASAAILPSHASLMESTPAILLRKRKLSDTSLIVHWCTESLGCVQTVAKGARSAKSPFAGKLDLFFEAEIQIARSKRSDLHTLREVALTNPFGGIRGSYLRTQTAAYFVELIEICTESDHHEPELFTLLRRAFGFLSANEPTLRAVSHFETELARIAGVHDAKLLKSDPAFALASLFGKLPMSRTALLKSLRAAAEPAATA